MRSIVPLLTLFAIESCSSLQAASQHVPGATSELALPVRISSLETGFVTKGWFKGTVHVYPESLLVVLDSTFISQLADASGRSVYHLDSLTVGLAISDGSNGGEYSRGPALLVADSLAERTAFSLGRVRVSISRPANQPMQLLRGNVILVTFYQIVVPSIVPRDQQGGSTTYAHSDWLFDRVKR